MAAKKTAKRKYGTKAQSNVEKAMRARKKGTLKSGSGRKVKSKKQAIAIALSEARKAGGKVPRKSSKRSAPKRSAPKRSAPKRKASGGSKRTSTKRSASKRTSTKRSSSKRSTKS